MRLSPGVDGYLFGRKRDRIHLRSDVAQMYPVSFPPSKEEDAAETLNGLKRRADESKNEKARGLMGKAQDVLKSTQESIEEVQAATQ